MAIKRNCSSWAISFYCQFFFKSRLLHGRSKGSICGKWLKKLRFVKTYNGWDIYLLICSFLFSSQTFEWYLLHVYNYYRALHPWGGICVTSDEINPSWLYVKRSFNPFPHADTFWWICSRRLLKTGCKTMRNFSLSHNVFYL